MLFSLSAISAAAVKFCDLYTVQYFDERMKRFECLCVYVKPV